MAASVRDYVTRYPNADYRTLTARFGEPQQIAETYVAEMEADELLQKLNIRKRLLRIVSIAAVTSLLLWASVVVYSLIHHVDAVDGYLVEEIIIIDETIYE